MYYSYESVLFRMYSIVHFLPAVYASPKSVVYNIHIQSRTMILSYNRERLRCSFERGNYCGFYCSFSQFACYASSLAWSRHLEFHTDSLKKSYLVRLRSVGSVLCYDWWSGQCENSAFRYQAWQHCLHFQQQIASCNCFEDFLLLLQICLVKVRKGDPFLLDTDKFLVQCPMDDLSINEQFVPLREEELEFLTDLAVNESQRWIEVGFLALGVLGGVMTGEGVM